MQSRQYHPEPPSPQPVRRIHISLPQLQSPGAVSDSGSSPSTPTNRKRRHGPAAKLFLPEDTLGRPAVASMALPGSMSVLRTNGNLPVSLKPLRSPETQRPAAARGGDDGRVACVCLPSRVTLIIPSAMVAACDATALLALVSSDEDSDGAPISLKCDPETLRRFIDWATEGAPLPGPLTESFLETAQALGAWEYVSTILRRRQREEREQARQAASPPPPEDKPVRLLRRTELVATLGIEPASPDMRRRRGVLRPKLSPITVAPRQMRLNPILLSYVLTR